MPKIKTIIFDFGGVLINLDREACVKRYKELGVLDADKLLDNYMQSGVFLALEKGELTLRDFHNQIRKISGRYISDNDIDDAFRAFLLDIPQRRMDKIKQLRKCYRTVILSNTNEIHFPSDSDLLVTGGYRIADYFDYCYLSYQMHLSKPDKAIFVELLRREGLKPQECLYLDDGECNITTAREMGFNCYLVNDDWVDKIDNYLE